MLRPATLAQLAGVVRELVDSGAHFVTQGAATGLDWAQLLRGSFGALGIVARATVKLHPIPRQSATALVALDSVETAVDMVCALEHSMGECSPKHRRMPCWWKCPAPSRLAWGWTCRPC
ncbi:FAD-binding oxidoreductase [Hydrogenophaga sp. BPS33]|uniref:FAD-binding oxidoreductase n=1 Tax=Hydrogenophaga sp. BPS33 TaxID=2651974 RepID=UPI00131F84BE|nr:hypothetical protein [Hydrogenophaga sp. BPS33]QHE83960.1 FAD-binding oxidoreductase [Hydrogenophaga sp. BPS33]